jgi:hypothetical protein
MHRTRVAPRALAASLALAALLAGTPSLAETPVKAPNSLVSVAIGSSVRTNLDTEITAERKAHPEAFQAVAAVIASADARDLKKRGLYAATAPLLHNVSLLALLEPLAFPERFSMPSREAARISLRAGLLEAAGALRDPKAAPLFREVLAGASEYYEVRAAAEALGKLGIESDVANLAQRVKTASPLQNAIIAGVGDCRKVAIVEALGAVPTDNETTARLIANALGRIGSSWAWETPALRALPEGPAVRAAAAKQAIHVYLATDGSTRATAADALTTVAWPQTTKIMETFRGTATPAQREALDALAPRVAAFAGKKAVAK